MHIDDLFAPVAAPAPRTDGFVLCEFAGLTVAIPQADVLTIEHGGSVAAALPQERALGWFESAQGPWPVFALDNQLQLLTARPERRNFLAFLTDPQSPVGILCDSVRILPRPDALLLQPLPALLSGDAQPVRSLARLGQDRTALVCGAGLLCAHVLDQAQSVTGNDIWSIA